MSSTNSRRPELNSDKPVSLGLDLQVIGTELGLSVIFYPNYTMQFEESDTTCTNTILFDVVRVKFLDIMCSIAESKYYIYHSSNYNV